MADGELLPTIAFCRDPLDRKVVDAAFRDEWEAARAVGFETILIDHDAAMAGDGAGAVKGLREAKGYERIVFRGWMLSHASYEVLHLALHGLGYRMETRPSRYALCHHLPRALEKLGSDTPRTHVVPWTRGDGEPPIDALLDLAGEGPHLIKDYVKSEKHLWHEACSIPDVADRESARRVILRFIQERGDSFEGGLVLREFETLKTLGPAGEGGLPAVAEWRTWWCWGEEIIRTPNHEAATGVELPTPPDEWLHEVTQRLRSLFFTLDVALRDDGVWRVIEPGDAQVAGLPPMLSAEHFYSELKPRLRLARL